MKTQSLKQLFTSASAKASVAAAALTFGGFAMAEGEGGEIPGLIAAAGVTVGLIGTAILAVYGAIKVFKVVRSAL